MVPRIAAIQIRVMLAFFASGGRKAWTPLLTASIPVIAAQPEAKARSSRKTVTGCTTPTSGGRGGASGGAPVRCL